MSAIKLNIPAFEGGFVELLYSHGFLGFCDLIDKANPQIVIDPPSINQAWFGAVCKGFKKWNGYAMGPVLSDEEKKSELMKALMEVDDAEPGVQDYWKAKAARTNSPHLTEKCEYPWEEITRQYNDSRGLSDPRWQPVHSIYSVQDDTSYTHEDMEVPTAPLKFSDGGMTGLELFIEQQRLVILSRVKRDIDHRMGELMEGLSYTGQGKKNDSAGVTSSKPQISEMERRNKLHGIDEDYSILDASDNEDL